MNRQARTLTLALCLPALALAAPAPAVRLVTAEAVVKPPNGNAREVAARLAAAPTAARVRTAVDERRGTVTLRVAGCQKKEALALLAAAVEAYKADALRQFDFLVDVGDSKELLIAIGPGGVAQVRRTGVPGVPMRDAGAVRAAIDRSVLQPPRVVPAGVFGRDAATRPVAP
jgi:hypothetical protein